MGETFPQILSRLRRERKLSQRAAATALHISQALLSHYENGLREPGLAFVDAACRFYGVSADYLLGRSPVPTPFGAQVPDALLPLLEQASDGFHALLEALGQAPACIPEAQELAEVLLYALLRPYDRESPFRLPEGEALALSEALLHLLRLRLRMEGEGLRLTIPQPLLTAAETRLLELKTELNEV